MVRRVPSSRYTDPKFLEREQRMVFQRAWLCLGPTSRAPRPGDYWTLDELGESILVVRDDRGKLGAFHNSCSHRGSRLMDGRGTTDCLRCPYHGWSYRLDGTLDVVPRPEGMRRLRKERMGLQPIRTAEFAGFLWGTLSPDTPPLLETLGSLPEELAPYHLEDMQTIKEKVLTVPVNWKAMLENVVDFYHVPVVHSKTINRHVRGGPDLASYGDHSRQRLDIAPYSWRRAIDRRCTRGGPYTEKQLTALHKYLIFPNFLINVLPYHLTMMQVFPIDVSSCRLHYLFCKRRGARGVELIRAHATAAASRYILMEDLEMLGRFQAGVATGRVKTQVLHAEEQAIAHFHTVLNRWVEA
jgi:phenylpropionate dioxygenase-like ring-hydroxylating dioxygenase large terminal subunit